MQPWKPSERPSASKILREVPSRGGGSGREEGMKRQGREERRSTDPSYLMSLFLERGTHDELEHES